MYHFANRDAVFRKIAKEFITLEFHDKEQMYPHIPLNDRVKVSQNWSHGICRKEVMLKWRINLLPWIHLDGDVLYLSQAADIGVYYLRPDRERLQRSPLALFSGHQEDVSICYPGAPQEEWVPCRVIKQDVNCLDCIGGLIVSGSRDRTARIWTLSSNCPRGTIPMNDKVWSVAISPTQRQAWANKNEQVESGVLELPRQLAEQSRAEGLCVECPGAVLVTSDRGDTNRSQKGQEGGIGGRAEPSEGSFVTGIACCENFSPLRIWDVE
ncbi:unnamed protein product, partial [Coregonus sp. 'balchen']